MWLLSYWVLPVISCVVWLATIAAMFGYWESVGRPHYPSMEPNQQIAYISDVGAFKLKPLFISGACVTTITLDLSFVAERWLRHTGRLARNTYTSQKILSVCSIICAIAGTAGLILLTIFDTYRHDRIHDAMLGLFMFGYAVSAIFLCAEYQRLGIHYRNHRVLRYSFWMKLAFILIIIVLAAIFFVAGAKENYNLAGGVEWIIALVFAFYVLSFVMDLLPSVRTKHHVPQGWKDAAREQEMGMSRPGNYGEPLTQDSAGPNQGNYSGNLASNPHDGRDHAYPLRSRNF